MTASTKMFVYKFIATRDYPVHVGSVVYKDCLAIVVAPNVSEARRIAKEFLANHKDPYANRTIDSAWIDFVDPTEFPVDTPCCIGATLG